MSYAFTLQYSSLRHNEVSQSHREAKVLEAQLCVEGKCSMNLCHLPFTLFCNKIMNVAIEMS